MMKTMTAKALTPLAFVVLLAALPFTHHMSDERETPVGSRQLPNRY